MKMKKAFTLIELLVVISVIALLLSIMLPALRAAKEKGKAVTCLSNLRQMALGLQLYINESNDTYCYNHEGLFDERSPLGSSGIMISARPKVHSGIEATFSWPSRLYAYVENLDLFYCPSLSKDYRWDGSELWYTTKFSYGWNNWPFSAGPGEDMGMGDAPHTSGRRRKATRVKRPSETYVIMDHHEWEAEETSAWYYCVGPDPMGTRTWQLPGDHHKGGSNIVFADCHAEPRDWNIINCVTESGEYDIISTRFWHYEGKLTEER